MNPPEKIRHIQQLLVQAMDEMNNRSPVDYSKVLTIPRTWPGCAQRACEAELEVERLVDAACREIGSTKCAPLLLTPKVQCFLQVRLHAASYFLDQMFPAASSDSAFQDLRADWSDEQILTWLLIDHWRRLRAHWLKLTSLAWFGPFEFEDFRLWRKPEL